MKTSGKRVRSQRLDGDGRKCTKTLYQNIYYC